MIRQSSRSLATPLRRAFCAANPTSRFSAQPSPATAFFNSSKPAAASFNTSAPSTASVSSSLPLHSAPSGCVDMIPSSLASSIARLSVLAASLSGKAGVSIDDL